MSIPWGERAADEGYDFEPDEYGPPCPICGMEQDRGECYRCFGEGGRDLYEENPNEHEPGEWQVCDECNGEGMYWQCPNVPHDKA